MVAEIRSNRAMFAPLLAAAVLLLASFWLALPEPVNTARAAAGMRKRVYVIHSFCTVAAAR